jgi:hypothetical protein
MAGSPRGYHMGGAQATQIHRVQVDCYGSDYKTASELGDALIALLEPASGAFQGSFVLRDDDRPEKIDTGEVHCRSLDFQITYVSA